MNFRQIEYYIELCKTLNYTKAAENLHVSQSAITKQIHLLEEELGVLLVDRSHKKIKLTSAGEFFYQEAIKVAKQIEISKRNLDSFLNGQRGHIRIGFIQHLNSQRLIRCMTNLKNVFPNITCDIYSFPNDVLYQQLEDGNLDCIIAITPKNPERYSSYFMKHYPLVVLMNKADPLANQSIVNENQIHYPLFDMRYQTSYSNDELEGTLLHIACFGGYAITYQYLEQNAYFTNIKAIPLDSKDCIEIGLVYKKDNYPMVVEKFIKALKKEFVEEQMAYPG